ncbi:MAG: NAD(P)-dependent oxidoreductase [Pseudomonadota bacterium]
MKIGFIGLGNVGGKLAGNLLANGVDLTVHDLDRGVAEAVLAQGARWAKRPADIARAADVVITCLPSPAASAAVMEAPGGVLETLGPGQIWAEMSTTDAAEMARLAARVAETGATAIECPVSGGCHRAATGNISIFAGGDRATFDAMLPVLTILGRRVLHTGPLGSASKLKVMTNYLATTHLVALAEALTTMAASGIDLATTYEAIRISSGTSFVHETESQVILNGSRDINFTMDLVLKDIGLFQDIADEHDVPLALSPLLVKLFEEANEAYGPREHSPNIIRRYEEPTGLSVRAPGFPAEMVDDEPPARGAEVVPRQV